jgi:hypothetical protein
MGWRSQSADVQGTPLSSPPSSLRVVARARARPAGPAQSSALHDFVRCGRTKEAHRRAFARSGGLLRSVAGQGHGQSDRGQRPQVPHPQGDPSGEELAWGLGPRTCCLQDRSGSSTACWRVVSLQLRSGGSSSQYAPVGPSSGRWNDYQNDMLPFARRDRWRFRRATPRGRLALGSPNRAPTASSPRAAALARRGTAPSRCSRGLPAVARRLIPASMLCAMM